MSHLSLLCHVAFCCQKLNCECHHLHEIPPVVFFVSSPFSVLLSFHLLSLPHPKMSLPTLFLPPPFPLARPSLRLLRLLPLRQHRALPRQRIPLHFRPYACATPDHPTDQIAPEIPSTPPQDPDKVLAAFEAAIQSMSDEEIEDMANDDENELSPRQRKKLEQRKQFLKRLEVLSEIPAELFVSPRKNSCSGCGSTIQTDSDTRPGYVPAKVMEDHLQRQIIPEQTEGDLEHVAEGKPKRVDKDKPLVCQRCYRLTHYGSIDAKLRVSAFPSQKTASPGELSPERFRAVLQKLSGVNAVIIYLVDIFDFHGTFISSLRELVGAKNPIFLAVNKVDLLPSDYNATRVENWVTQECAALSLTDVVGVHLISSTRGMGVNLLLADTMKLAKKRRADIYVVGAANVGKSSFINQIIRLRQREKDRSRGTDKKKRDDSVKGGLTTSVVPGTTLDVIKIPLSSNVSLFDTPGLMMPHQLTNYLDATDLKMVLPSKNVEKVTVRMGEGKALFIGALATLEVVSGRPFFFTAFFSPLIKIHPGSGEEPEEFMRRHAGGMLTPPSSPEALEKLGEWTAKTFVATGEGWKKSCMDIVLSGLGWIAVTGVGEITLRVQVPKGVGVFTREPLMPFETQTGASAYTGTSLVNRRQMKVSARKRKRSRSSTRSSS